MIEYEQVGFRDVNKTSRQWSMLSVCIVLMMAKGGGVVGSDNRSYYTNAIQEMSDSAHGLCAHVETKFSN